MLGCFNDHSIGLDLRKVWCDAGSTCTELPTLLHLSAKHGLLDLSTNLLDLPNSDNARRLSNADGLSPAMLATRNGHTQLAAMLADQVVSTSLFVYHHS